MSSSTPNECKRSSTVFDIIGGPRRKWLARRNSHASLACRTSSSSHKLEICGSPVWLGTSAAHLPWKRQYLTCSTLMKAKETSCTIISGINRVNKNRGLIFVSPLSLFKSYGLTTEVRTPPLWENTAYLLTNSPEIRSAHFCAYFIAIAYSRKRTKRFYIINNHSVFSCASTWFTEWLSIMWLYATYCENRQSTFRMRPYPPKLSNIIMSSSTPKEWSKSSTVLDIIGGPQR